MPRLVLLRHGKSDWSAPFERDRDRPLAPRGIDAARRAGRFLSQSGRVPERAVVSPASRTRETMRLATEAGAWSIEVEESAELYETDARGVLAVLRRLPDTTRSALVVGHEPSLSGLVALLTAGAPPRFPTAALAGLRLEQQWSALGPGGAELRWLLPARLLATLEDGARSLQ